MLERFLAQIRNGFLHSEAVTVATELNVIGQSNRVKLSMLRAVQLLCVCGSGTFGDGRLVTGHLVTIVSRRGHFVPEKFRAGETSFRRNFAPEKLRS